MNYKKINICITMLIPESDCLDIDSIGNDLMNEFNNYGQFVGISYDEIKKEK